MRRATESEEEGIREGLARHGVVAREVWVRPGEVVNAGAPVRGRMVVSEGFLTAPAWRQAAILAHEAGHVRLRHTPWLVGAWAAGEALQMVARLGLAPVMLGRPAALAAGIAGVLLCQAGLFVGLCAQYRRLEFAADRWAVEHGGITGGGYMEHLALLPQPVARSFQDRLLATHPSNERRIERVRRRATAA